MLIGFIMANDTRVMDVFNTYVSYIDYFMNTYVLLLKVANFRIHRTLILYSKTKYIFCNSLLILKCLMSMTLGSGIYCSVVNKKEEKEKEY